MSNPGSRPSWPEAPQPQQRSCRSRRERAGVRAAGGDPGRLPATTMRVGAGASISDPLPSWPLPFAPQQNSAGAPSASSAVAQVCAPPAASAPACARPGTCTGVARTGVAADRELAEVVVAPAVERVVGGERAGERRPRARRWRCRSALRDRLVPSPSCPLSFAPQQVTGSSSPPSRTMQVCCAPAATSIGSMPSAPVIAVRRRDRLARLRRIDLSLPVAAPAGQAVVRQRAGVVVAGDDLVDAGSSAAATRGPAPSAGAGWSACRRRSVPGCSRPSTSTCPPVVTRARVLPERGDRLDARRRRRRPWAERGGPAAAPASPSWPTLSSPQQRTPPLASTAQEKSLAAASERPFAARSPRRDARDLAGQPAIDAAAVAELAGVVGAPAEDGAAAGGRAGVRVAGRDRDDVADAVTRTGSARGVRVPSPSWPRSLRPQHHRLPSVVQQAGVPAARAHRGDPVRPRTTPARRRRSRRRRGGRSAGATARSRPGRRRCSGRPPRRSRARRRPCTGRAPCSESRPGHARGSPARAARARRPGGTARAPFKTSLRRCRPPGPMPRSRSAARSRAGCSPDQHEARDADGGQRGAERQRADADLPARFRRRPAAVVRVVGRRCSRRRGARSTDAGDEADPDRDADDAGARQSQAPRIVPPLGRRRWRRRRRSRRLDDDDLGVLGHVLRAAAERDLRRVRLHRGRVGREEPLVQRHRALAVAREPLGLSLGEQELAPRLDRVARLEIGDRGRRSRARRSARARACRARRPPAASAPRRRSPARRRVQRRARARAWRRAPRARRAARARAAGAGAAADAAPAVSGARRHRERDQQREARPSLQYR